VPTVAWIHFRRGTAPGFIFSASFCSRLCMPLASGASSLPRLARRF
jgi:hypothetical protein